MKARDARAGGKHIAQERGAEADEPHEADVREIRTTEFVGTRLIDRLDAMSLLEVCKILGISAAELEQRYS